MIKKVLYKISTLFSRFFRYFYLKKLKKRYKKRVFTIISQNCVGGVVYHSLGVEFQSPTINLFIEGEDFYKFVKNLSYYLNIKPTVLSNDKSLVSYPILLIDDIKIHCMHYQNSLDAIEAWERRKRRVDLNGVLVICNSWDLLDNEELIIKTINCGYPTICFSTIDIDNPNVIKLDGRFKKNRDGIVSPPLTGLVPFSPHVFYETQVDIYSWIDKNISK